MQSLAQFLKKYKLVVVAVAVGVVGFAGAFVATNLNAADEYVASCNEPCIRLQTPLSNPDIITVTAGSYVEFVGARGDRHNLQLSDSHSQENPDHDVNHAASYSSGDFGRGEAWRVQFKEDGTYSFVDSLNPEIKAVVIVYTEGKEYKI